MRKNQKLTVGLAVALVVAGAASFLAFAPEGQSSASPGVAKSTTAKADGPGPAVANGLLFRSGGGPSQSIGDESEAGALPVAVVHKSPTCSCCEEWVKHLKREGFQVRVHETNDLRPIKDRLGVPPNKIACHTAQVGPYVIEGHVPASDIKRLLSQGGDSKGLVLPGMPPGSPGMGTPAGPVEPYTVERIDSKGATHPFNTHQVR